MIFIIGSATDSFIQWHALSSRHYCWKPKTHDIYYSDARYHLVTIVENLKHMIFILASATDFNLCALKGIMFLKCHKMWL